MQHLKAKFKAFSIHLLLSAMVISLFLLVITQLWFPGALFKLENVWQGLEILIPVDATLGPLLTLVLFVPGKKGMKFDLWVIGILQVSALFYGGYMIHSQRPALIAFVVDRFEVVLASETFIKDIPMDRFEKKGHPLITYVLPPQSSTETTHFITSGIKFNNEGNRHYPIAENLDEVTKRSLAVDRIKPKTKTSSDALSKFIEQNKTMDDLLLLPIQASSKESIIVVIDAQTGSIKQYLEVDPWTEYIKPI